MLFSVVVWYVLFLAKTSESVSGGYFREYYGYSSKLYALSSKLPLQLNCSDGVPIPLFTIDKTFTRQEEKHVLQQFYIETSGYNWTIKRGWQPDPNGTEIDHCHWAGVTCDKKFGYVIGLSLNKNNLNGLVPNFLWKLRNLMLLCLPHNPELHGELKDFVSHNMSKLLRIDLAFCSLSGTLPNGLFVSLKSLVKIQLCCQNTNKRREGIYGHIPPSIFDLKDLQVLSLGENRLTGQIPSTIGKLKKVWFLDLEFMTLSLNISYLLGMKSLKQMHLSRAGVYGEIPDNFGSYFPHMRECQLRNNTITGFIPTSVNKMKNLTKLVLCGNSLRGNVPKELSELTSLRILDLSHNILQGIEDGLDFKDSSLEIFLLQHNPSLSALFEDLISALAPIDPEKNPSTLRLLDISYCDFKGQISPSVWTLSSLIELNLKHNKIAGKIPDVLDDVMFLTHADFSENNLKGAIPNNIILLQSLLVFDIRNNPLMKAPITSVNVSSGVIQEYMLVDPNSRMKADKYSCPYTKFATNNGRVFLGPGYYYNKFCVCNHGYFGHLGRCKKCISGGDCPDKTSNDVDPKIYLNIKKGYWPSPSVDNATHFIRCPGSVHTAEGDLACNPNGNCRCWVNTSTPELRTVCDKSCICHSGNTGRLCSKCEKDHFKNGYLCKKCSEASISPYILIPIVIVCLVALWGVFRFCKGYIKVKFSVVALEFIILIILRSMEVISGWIFEVSIVVSLFYMAGIMKNTRGLVNILVFHIQVLDAVMTNTEAPLPDFLYDVQHFMSSIFNLDFPGIACRLPFLFTPLGKYMLIFLFPLGCLLMIWMYYGVRWIISKFLYRSRGDQEERERQERLENVRCQCLKVSITCLILTYFPIVKHTLVVISPCDRDGDIGNFMRLEPWIKCDSMNRTYKALEIFGYLAITIYGIAELIALWVLLRWYRFNKDQFSDKQKKMCASWLGAVYLPYKENVQSAYFEVIKLSTKLLIALLLAFIPNTSSIQTFTIAFVLLLALVYEIKVEPYAKHEKGNFGNSLEALSLIALQQSTILLQFTSYDPKNSKGFIWIVIAVNVLVLIAIVFTLPLVIINLFSANTPDGSTPDANTPDANAPNANTPDGSTPDANTPDESTPLLQRPRERPRQNSITT